MAVLQISCFGIIGLEGLNAVWKGFSNGIIRVNGINYYLFTNNNNIYNNNMNNNINNNNLPK